MNNKLKNILNTIFFLFLIVCFLATIFGIWGYKPYNIENFNLKLFGTSAAIMILSVIIYMSIDDKK